MQKYQIDYLLVNRKGVESPKRAQSVVEAVSKLEAVKTWVKSQEFKTLNKKNYIRDIGAPALVS